MSDRRGFTLVEVLLATAIIAMVVAAAFAVLRLAHRADEKGTERAEETQRVMVLSDRVSWLLAGAYPLKQPDEEAEKERLVFEGLGDSLEFVTTSVDAFSNSPEDLPGLKHLRLSLGPEGLIAAERVFYIEDDEWQEYLLEPYAISLEIEYLEQDPDSGETTWVGNWDPEDREYMPLAVRLRIALDMDGRRVDVPTMVVRLPAGGEDGVPIPLPRAVTGGRGS